MRTRVSGVWFAVVLGVVAVLGVSAPALAAADATGTWTWTFERNGNTIESTLVLKQDGEKLTGTYSRSGSDTKTDIEDGKVKGDTVTFKVTREFGGNKVVIQYEGKVSGDTIKGETKVERDGQERKREWEAKRSK